MLGKRLKEQDRFYEKERYQSGFFSAQLVIFVDKQTGVNYLASAHGLYPDCLTPLLGPDGKPVIDDITE